MEDGQAVSVTVLQAGPCPIVLKKSVDSHGYAAYQIGFGDQRKKLVNKPKAGHFAKANVEPTRYLKEIRFDGDLEVGSEIKVDVFNVGERVDITGVSRGLGFAGTMKRHHFSGANKTHGQSDRWRAPGSIGQSSYPSRVFKGIKMSGRMGKDKVTTMNLEIVKIIEDENLMLVKGAVPGFKGSMVKIRSTNRG
jgi:large subunit ribosomal protein L3